MDTWFIYVYLGSTWGDQSWSINKHQHSAGDRGRKQTMEVTLLESHLAMAKHIHVLYIKIYIMIVCVPTVSLHCIYIHTYIYILYLCIFFVFYTGRATCSWGKYQVQAGEIMPPSSQIIGPPAGTDFPVKAQKSHLQVFYTAFALMHSMRSALNADSVSQKELTVAGPKSARGARPSSMDSMGS